MGSQPDLKNPPQDFQEVKTDPHAEHQAPLPAPISAPTFPEGGLTAWLTVIGG